MGKVKIIPFTSKILKDGSHPLMIRVSSFNQRKYIGTGLKCKTDHWDNIEDFPNEKYRSHAYKDHISKDKMIIKLVDIKRKMQKVIDQFDDNDVTWTCDQFVMAYNRKKQRPMTVLRYFDEVTQRLRKSRRIGTAEAYFHTKKSLENFLEKDISFHELTASLLQKFKEYHESRGNKPGTIAVHLRTIRVIYNRAIIDGYANKENYPFIKGLIPNGKPAKRAMTQDEFIKFKNEKLEDPALIRARDYFLFSFYTRGMNFFDLAMLKVKNIKNNVITYERHKTKGRFNIAVVSQLEPIIEKYAKGKTGDEFLFPIVNPKFTGEVSRYNRIKKARNRVNQNLRIIAKLADIDQNITFYVARHSFATIMKYKGVSTEAIQEFLGHQDVKTTENYLKSFGDPVLDELIKQTIDF